MTIDCQATRLVLNVRAAWKRGARGVETEQEISLEPIGFSSRRMAP